MTKARLYFEAGSPRYSLDGKPLHAGDTLEVQLEGNGWVLGRYEYSWLPHSRKFDAYVLTAQQRFDITTVHLRWPDAD